jgi:hypothetical protein
VPEYPLLDLAAQRPISQSLHVRFYDARACCIASGANNFWMRARVTSGK